MLGTLIERERGGGGGRDLGFGGYIPGLPPPCMNPWSDLCLEVSSASH